MTVVIDDAGLAEPSLVQRLCRIAAPFSVAVLPGEAHSVECAEIAHRAGKEVMVHLPLEPLSKPPGLYLGREPITFDMAEDAVRLRVRQHLAAVPHRVGVNNHMGSRITPDRQRMTWILQEIKAKGLFFVDSRTIKDTVACSVARELGIPAAQRTVYLDNERSVPAIRTQWQQCVAAAQKDGWALAIGHVHDETITAMEELVPASKGVVRFITAGELTTRQRH
ncbi:MAG: divergent polysaccharide deacetylase family protein [Verrucomicrobia bacterium]|nr:divergent polysaccharide deacetylase family protein [Verrucomicrobiota bacterium]